MADGFQSLFVADTLTRRQIIVERAKTTLNSEHIAVTEAVIAALLAGLQTIDALRLGEIGKARVGVLLRRVLSAYDVEAGKYNLLIMSWLENYSNQEAAFMTGLMNTALTDADEEPITAWPAVVGGIIGATGLGIVDTMRNARASQRGSIKMLIQRAFIQNWTPQQLINAFRGTRVRKFKDGVLGKLTRAMGATVDTVVQFGMSASRAKAVESFLDWTLGYTWVSMLDARTSTICRSLSGRVFKYGAGPIPPMHFRCRSHIMPIFRRTAKLNPIANKAFTAGETYFTWLKRQPIATQQDVLGVTRSKLFRDGGLSPDEFAATVVNRTYEPITLDQMKRRSPDVFSRAGI